MVTAACKGVDGGRSGDNGRRLANGNLLRLPRILMPAEDFNVTKDRL